MKKIIFSLFIAFAIFFSSVDNAKAQPKPTCEPGWTYGSTIYMLNGCSVDIGYCYKCAFTGADAIEIKYLWAKYNWINPCTMYPPMTDLQFINAINNILRIYVLDDVLKACNMSVPCDPNGVIQPAKVRVYRAFCYRQAKFEYYDINNNLQTGILTEDCRENGYCNSLYNICIDENYNPKTDTIDKKYKWTLVGNHSIVPYDSNGCENRLSDIPYNGNFPVMGPNDTETPCFKVYDDCNLGL